MREQLLRATLAHFESVAIRARTNLEIYLNSAVAVPEHRDTVSEVVELTKEITEADDNIRTVEGLLTAALLGEEQ